MASTYSKLVLSGSSAGKGILVSGSAVGAANTIHTAVSGSSSYDEIWLYATNNNSADVNLTICWGGTTNPNDYIQMSIPKQAGLYLIVPGLVLNSNMILKAFASVANQITIHGWVNEVT